MYRTDGGIVDAEMLRPRWWIEQHGIQAGKLLPMSIEELQVKGSALVTSIDDCPEIAGGEGSVVTSRFCTREVHTIAQVEILGPDGQIETLSGTPIHPIWSEDRQDWVPLGELEPDEQLRSLLPSPRSGRGIEGEGHSLSLGQVLSVTILNQPVPVYNIEVNGEHVYQVGELGWLVHNAANDCAAVLAKFPGSTLVDITKLQPPLGGREFADPIKLRALGAFEWSKYRPIEVIRDGGVIRVQDGMTRVEAALRLGITKIPAFFL